MSKENIKTAIRQFSQGSLTENALHLFKTLGYNTERQAPLDRPDYATFKDSFINDQSKFNEEKALVKEWNSVDLLFQLSKEEMAMQNMVETQNIVGTQNLASLQTPINNTIIESYLFFAVELNDSVETQDFASLQRRRQYTRTELSNITREVNRLFPMPVMLLFKHGETLTLSVINRRLHKRDEGRDVLEKVTLIKDIRIDNPHRAHIEILFDLASDELLRKQRFTNFVELHNAWQKTLDTKELNKRFFQELANWFFWAQSHVQFPNDRKIEEKRNHQINLIRLITRLIFVWFLKEKNLVEERLFDKTFIRKMLKDFDPDSEKTRDFYPAILQNLFFGTLNQKMTERGFVVEGSFHENKEQYGVKTLYRYASLFNIPETEIVKLFKDIPFLNGGLFDCLDKENEETSKVEYVDGFSRNSKKVPFVPDCLFFGKERIVDLTESYGFKKNNEKFRGIIEIFEDYKFTIEENTPIEEEIALDPELLGKVFENLLAYYNPETESTARKQTGSFYTPREIVNYMVDESLIAYLKMQLLSTNQSYIEFGAIQAKLFANDVPGQLTFTETTSKSRWTGKEDELEAALRHLIHYNNDPHPFNEQEVQRLIFAIDHCKILDPACGSGAFPMGVLHKLVYLLGKLDERNIRWRELQKMKAIRDTEEAFNIGDVKIREDKLMEINETFENNAGDYGRKLYLIENCIYGVDIQAIAVQISKLRFFISLVVDQKEREWAENRGIRPLPNLETKFVAANTLIGLDKPTQLVLMPGEIETLKKELRQVRHQHFEAKSRKEKLQCQKRDKAIRQKIAALLKSSGWANKDADNIAVFDIYDQYNSAAWFDPEWMFGIKDGFDITIGNPPYFNISTVSKELVNTLSAQHKAIHTGYNDIVYYFIYLGIELLKKTGCCALITSNYYLGNEYAKKIRLYLKDHASKIINFKDHMVFDAASVHTCISISYKEPTSDVITFFEPTDEKQITSSDIEAELKSFEVKRSVLNDNWIVADQSNTSIFEKLKQGSALLGDIAIIEQGSKSGKNDVFTIPSGFAEKTKIEPAVLRKNIKNGDIDRFIVRDRGNFLIYVDNNTTIEHFPNAYSYLKKHKEVLSNRNEVKQGLYSWSRFDRPRNKAVFDAHEKIVVPYRAENNRFAYDNKQYFNDGGDIRAIVINNDKDNIKYVLAILNSRLIDWFYGFIGKPKGKVREYFNAPLSLIPIKQCSLTDQQPFITLVDQILAAKTTPPSAPLLSKEGNKGVVDTSALEKQIDEMVYKLYDLTPEEIRVVEGKG